ncbi:hypothetical protein EHQ30_13115 [Leptospira brenneri]|uniref:HNH endonuclease n=1 Tax=Leptospira brenneri TaxID=2023182 RepID=A0A5F1Z5H8_9LEPT|nr:hypothetical protein [Leptospira brenneri]TGK92460.1 hypothetical protein EHQ30_13115 [Leptospira brenneri]
MNQEECKLCLKQKKLENSHIIPSFVINWLKKTSLTGHLRNPNDSNRRIQDGQKIKLLCRDCEAIFSTYESQFNRKIFMPYVNNHMDLSGEIVKDGSLKYDTWNLKFIISLQWRIFSLGMENFIRADNDPNPHTELIKKTNEHFRRYLNSETTNTGNNNTYILFLRNINNYNNVKQLDLSPKLNHYLIRSYDASFIYNNSQLFYFSKIGPIAFITSILPNKLVGYPDSRVKLKGAISVIQKWLNEDLNHFIFVKRPKQMDLLRKKTENQKAQIEKAIGQNLHRKNDTMTLHVTYSDFLRSGIDD